MDAERARCERGLVMHIPTCSLLPGPETGGLRLRGKVKAGPGPCVRAPCPTPRRAFLPSLTLTLCCLLPKIKHVLLINVQFPSGHPLAPLKF